MARLSPLDYGDTHVWIAHVPETFTRSSYVSYMELLNEAEHDRLRKIVHQHRKNEYLTTRALVRTVLSKYTGCHPRSLCFCSTKQGKPELLDAAGATPLRFNLSNTTGLVALIVNLNQSVGVDVEAIRRDISDVSFERWFTPKESSVINASPPSLKQLRFFQFWTLKEAFLKALGTGLTTPLDAFEFEIVEFDQIELSLFDQLRTTPDEWQFSMMRPTDNHILSIAVQNSKSSRSQISVQRIFESNEYIE